MNKHKDVCNNEQNSQERKPRGWIDVFEGDQDLILLGKGTRQKLNRGKRILIRLPFILYDINDDESVKKIKFHTEHSAHEENHIENKENFSLCLRGFV